MTIYQKVYILLLTCFCCNTFWLFEPLTQSTKVFCVASVVLQRVGAHPRFYHTTLHVIATDGPCCHLSTLSSSSQSMFVCRSDTHACWRPFVHIRLCKKPTISLPKTKYAAHKLENYHPQLLSVQIRGWNKVWRQPEHQSRHQNSVRASWQKRDSICVCISTFSGFVLQLSTGKYRRQWQCQVRSMQQHPTAHTSLDNPALFAAKKCK